MVVVKVVRNRWVKWSSTLWCSSGSFGIIGVRSGIIGFAGFIGVRLG